MSRNYHHKITNALQFKWNAVFGMQYLVMHLTPDIKDMHIQDKDKDIQIIYFRLLQKSYLD